MAKVTCTVPNDPTVLLKDCKEWNYYRLEEACGQGVRGDILYTTLKTIENLSRRTWWCNLYSYCDENSRHADIYTKRVTLLPRGTIITIEI